MQSIKRGLWGADRNAPTKMRGGIKATAVFVVLVMVCAGLAAMMLWSGNTEEIVLVEKDKAPSTSIILTLRGSHGTWEEPAQGNSPAVVTSVFDIEISQSSSSAGTISLRVGDKKADLRHFVPSAGIFTCMECGASNLIWVRQQNK
jgi:hypothetical protein